MSFFCRVHYGWFADFKLFFPFFFLGVVLNKKILALEKCYLEVI